MTRKQILIFRRNLNQFNRQTLLGLRIEPVKWKKKPRLSIAVQNSMKVKELGLHSISELPAEVRKLPHKNKITLKIPVEKENLNIIISLGYIPKVSSSKKKRHMEIKYRTFVKNNAGLTDGLNCKKRRVLKRSVKIIKK